MRAGPDSCSPSQAYSKALEAGQDGAALSSEPFLEVHRIVTLRSRDCTLLTGSPRDLGTACGCCAGKDGQLPTSEPDHRSCTDIGFVYGLGLSSQIVVAVLGVVGALFQLGWRRRRYEQLKRDLEILQLLPGSSLAKAELARRTEQTAQTYVESTGRRPAYTGVLMGAVFVGVGGSVLVLSPEARHGFDLATSLLFIILGVTTLFLGLRGECRVNSIITDQLALG